MGRERSLLDVRRIVDAVAPLVVESVQQLAIQPDLDALARPGDNSEELRRELQRYQEADLLLESGGDPNAVSSAGAVGVAQWLPGTARRVGLKVDLAAHARIQERAAALSAEMEAARHRPPDWSRPLRPGGPLLTRDQWLNRCAQELDSLERRRLAADERFDPRLSIFAQTRYLVRLWRRFGSLDWALKAYHGGERGAARTIALYLREEAETPSAAEPADGGDRMGEPGGLLRGPADFHPGEARSRVSFASVYFGVSPKRRARTFSYLYGRGDDHRYYWWRVLMARRALAVYRESPDRFFRQWLSLSPGYPLDRAWYPEALEAPFADVAALQSAYRRGILVPIPNDPARHAFIPSSVAPLDSDNEHWYRGVRPEALAMLERLAAIYRDGGGKDPLRVTGAVTTIAYVRLERARIPGARRPSSTAAAKPGKESRSEAAQRNGENDTAGRVLSPGTRRGLLEKLGLQGRRNPAASPLPPLTLHAAGLAVDIARPEDEWDRKVLEYSLSRMGDRMRIAWLRDPAAGGYHLCPNPAFARELLAAAR